MELALLAARVAHARPVSSRCVVVVQHGGAGVRSYVDEERLALEPGFEVGLAELDDDVLALGRLRHREERRHVLQRLRPAVRHGALCLGVCSTEARRT